MLELPSADTLFDVLDATWPAAAIQRKGAFLIRNGKGGGKRVSAATSLKDAGLQDVVMAETAMSSFSQVPLFQLRDEETLLDDTLKKRGYELVDPVTMYVIPAIDLADQSLPRTAAIPAWEPLKIMEEIWAAGGVGPERLNVMRRAKGPKTGFVSRWNDKPAGASFLAMHSGVGMVHALEILSSQRRQGIAKFLMRRAAKWVLQNGGTHLSVVCTTANVGANALYTSLNMSVVGKYHYRLKPVHRGDLK
ncbi:GNAT family N-acetyltransferase [Shimia sp. NS0008-38b]|uniref:GNAT family N-acetyltransferase n=1 Tax=Shimia sp. NS0008-38b TaxID=3127653 RepID=UPI00310C4520